MVNLVKRILVLSLIAASMVILVILLDLAMHINLNNILSEEMKPFRVTEQTTIVILLIFLIYFVAKAGIRFIKKRQQEKTTQNR